MSDKTTPETPAPAERQLDEVPIKDRKAAFMRYKAAVASSGKPFFPNGVWHDVIMAVVVIGVILTLSWVWFAQANCDSVWKVKCGIAATPLEQHQYTPGQPGALVFEKDGKQIVVPKGEEPPAGATLATDAKEPVLGPLYEEKADPASTSYHPRPEWYFYFLFELLILFSNPYLVVFGTIIVPTILLVAMIAYPFLDRRRERRPSRRPVAMTAMVVTAAVLFTLTYLGAHAGEETGPEGIDAAQQAMPGFALIFEDPRGATCKSCHVIGGSGGAVGPALDEEAAKNRGIDWQIRHMIDPASETPGSGMPAQGEIFNEEEIAQLAAFLETLGAPERASQPQYTDVSAATTAAALGEDEATTE
jgi:menaquinol-cytochrome c reductase cytochrome b/c subunit